MPVAFQKAGKCIVRQRAYPVMSRRAVKATRPKVGFRVVDGDTGRQLFSGFAQEQLPNAVVKKQHAVSGITEFAAGAKSALARRQNQVQCIQGFTGHHSTTT